MAGSRMSRPDPKARQQAGKSKKQRAAQTDMSPAERIQLQAKNSKK